ncbi:MAG: hypothetical protein HOP19_07750 [Acidobacteria bacterium]|nr:hypothetical protein [Acidobacteriota bacterium]
MSEIEGESQQGLSLYLRKRIGNQIQEMFMKEQKSNEVVSLAIMVGFFAFLFTSNSAGGLSGLQGFFLGFLVVILCYAVLVILASRQQERKNFSDLKLRIPKEASFTQTETENGVMIQVFVNPTAALSSGKER